MEELNNVSAEQRKFAEDPQMLFVSMTSWRLLNEASKAWKTDSEMRTTPALISAGLLVPNGDFRAVFSDSLVQLGKQFTLRGLTVSEVETALEGVPDSVAEPIRSGAFDSYLDDEEYPDDFVIAGCLPVIVGRLGIADDSDGDEAQMHQFFAGCLDAMWGTGWRGKKLGEIVDSESWQSTVGVLYRE